MEVKAVAKGVRVQPRKVRLVAREVRGKNAAEMVNVLRFHPSKGAFTLRKVIASAIANAENNYGMRGDRLKVSIIQVDEGPKFKRIQARAMGRANRIFKRTSHITVVVTEADAVTAATAGTPAKPRPSFENLKTKKKAKAAPVAEVVEEVKAEEAAVEEAPAEEPTAEATETTDASGEETK